MNEWNSEYLYESDVPEEFNTWSGWIPTQEEGMIQYYIQSGDSSGELKIVHWLVGMNFGHYLRIPVWNGI